MGFDCSLQLRDSFKGILKKGNSDGCRVTLLKTCYTFVQKEVTPEKNQKKTDSKPKKEQSNS